MERSISERRRRFLALPGSLPAGLLSGRGNAQPRQLDLTCFYPPEAFQAKGAQLLADEIVRSSAGAIQVSVESEMMTPPEVTVEKAALLVYCAPCVAKSEPLFSLSTLPMLASTFDEAATLHRIAKPHYGAALGRRGQMLLATQPWIPGALWSTFPVHSVADLNGAPYAVLATPGVDIASGWGRPFARLGARPVSFFEAEVVVASAHLGHVLKLTREFAYLTEIFFAAPLTFQTARRDAFDALSETERQMLVRAGRDTELALWRLMNERLPRSQQEIAARGVRVVARPPVGLLTALREAAEPDIRAWAQSVGADGGAILADYHRAIGRG